MTHRFLLVVLVAAVLVGCEDHRSDVPEATLIAAPGTPSVPCVDLAVVPVDTAATLVRWKGTKFRGRGKHEGTVRVADGHVEVCDGTLAGGTFTVDMQTIAVTDIPAHEPVPRRRLTDHLRSDDFFAVEAYPTARLEIASVTPVGGDSVRVEGPLMLRGRTRQIAFDAHLGEVSPEAVRVDARFGIDRQLWGVAYRGSELTNDLVDDVVVLDIHLTAHR